MTTTETRDEFDQSEEEGQDQRQLAASQEDAEPKTTGEAPASEKPKRGRKPRAAQNGHATNGATQEDSAPLSLAESIKGRMSDARKDAVTARAALYAERTKIEASIRELDEILGEGGPVLEPVIERQSTRRAAAGTKSKSRGKARRHRRTAEEIEAGVKAIVAAVKKSGSEGMRAEDIKTALKLEAAEMPKLLKTAVEGKQLKSKGQKRATRYFVK